MKIPIKEETENQIFYFGGTFSKKTGLEVKYYGQEPDEKVCL